VKIRVTGEKPADSVNVTGGQPSRVIEVAAGLVSSVNGRQGSVTGLAEAADLQVHEDATAGVHGIIDTAALLTEVPFDDTAIRDVAQNSLPGVSTAAARADHTHGGASGAGGGLTGIYDVTKAPYNAVGNGVADDLAAIEAAITAANAAGGGTVYLPPGRTYGVSDHMHILTGVTVVAYGATIKGIANRGLAKLYRESDTAFTGYTGHSRIRIYGGIWDVNASDGTTGTATSIVNAFLLGHNNDITFRDVTIRNVSSGHGIDLVACQNVRILNCRFEGFRDNTVDQSSSFREAIQLDFAVSGSGINGAFDGTGCRNILVQGCSFGASARLGGFGRAVGSHSSNNATTWCDGVQILGNRIEATLQEGVRVYAWKNVVVADNIVSGTGSAGIIVTGPDPAVAGYALPCQDVAIRGNVLATAGGSSPLRVIGFATARPTGVSFIGNRVTGSGSTGIYVSQADQPQIADNKISASTSSSIYAINCAAPLITGNQCAGSGATSIGIDTCTGGHVTTNVVDGSSSHGILVSGGSNVTVATNRVVGATGSGIRATSSTVRPRIIGNTILRNGVTATWGLDVTASATDALIIGNDLTGGAWPAGTAFNLVGTRQRLDWSAGTDGTAAGLNLAT
jgi:parallel beta-helix repeat protein